MTIKCNLCPRLCGADRDDESGNGVCGMGNLPVVARAAPHMWEEPCISGDRGSGAVFFSGCNLGCVYCQNHSISAGRYGERITVQRLRKIFFELIEKGVHNINLVSPTIFVPAIREALQKGLPVPVAYNTGGYERVETLRSLEGMVQIYIPDLKYAEAEAAERYSSCRDYPEVAKAAILEMYRQTGPYELDEYGIMRRGVLIRHLVLPGNLKNTRKVIEWVSRTFRPGEVLFSLMGQYMPRNDLRACPELTRPLTEDEYDEAMYMLEEYGIEDGFYQELSSADEEFIPEFDLTGVLEKD